MKKNKKFYPSLHEQDGQSWEPSKDAMQQIKNKIRKNKNNFYPSLKDDDEINEYTETAEETEVKPTTAPPITKPGTQPGRPSPIRRVRPSVDPRPKATLKDVIKRYQQLKYSSMKESLNETTEVDDMVLGRTVLDISDLFDKLKYNSISGIFKKKIVAADESDRDDLLIKSLEQNGYSIGKMQSSDPRGFKKGRYVIEKWRNLAKEDQEQLDGILIEQDDIWYALYFVFPEHASI